MNITVDDNKKILIDAAIKEAVLKLGHTKDAVVKVADVSAEPIKVEVAPVIVKYFAPDGVTELQPVTIIDPVAAQ